MPAGGDSWKRHAPQTLTAFRGVPTRVVVGHIEPRVSVVPGSRDSRPRVTVQSLLPPDVSARDAGDDASDMQDDNCEERVGEHQDATPGKRMQIGFNIEMTKTALQAAEMTSILDPARAPTGKVPDRTNGGSYTEQEAWDHKARGGGDADASVHGSSGLYDLGSHTVPVGSCGAGVGGGQKNGAGMNLGRPKSGFPLLRSIKNKKIFFQ